MARVIWLLIVAGLLLGLFISNRFALLAQGPREGAQAPSIPLPRTVAKPGTERAGDERLEIATQRERAPSHSAPATGAPIPATVQDALLRPFNFSFPRPTSLEQVCVSLQQTLRAPVVLDRAALKRQSVKPEDTVQLELDGVRLKTGLKLLLDQLSLTYRVIAEDNLMIITDLAGAEDSANRILAELRALHRDLHEVQDTVNELLDYRGVEGAEGSRVRKPTIIEEVPENSGDKPALLPKTKPGDGGRKEEGARVPSGTRPGPSRIPLGHPRRGG
jgi:hypothetical protein